MQNTYIKYKILFSKITLFTAIILYCQIQNSSCFAQAGSLDLSFDTDGIVTTDISSIFESGNSIALQTDGKILVAGYYYNGVNSDFVLVRYNIDGSLDSTLDLDGIVTTDFGSGHDWGYSVTVHGWENSGGRVCLQWSKL